MELLINGNSGVPDMIPHLTARPFWNFTPEDNLFYFIMKLQANINTIKRELLSTKGKRIFQPYRAPNWANPNRKAEDGYGSLAHDSGDWNILYLLLHNVDFTENCKLFPETMKLLRDEIVMDDQAGPLQVIEGDDGRRCFRPRMYRHVFFSALSPGTHIAKHHGPTNKKLRIHVPLLLPSNKNLNEPMHSACSGIRVGDQTENFCGRQMYCIRRFVRA